MFLCGEKVKDLTQTTNIMKLKMVSFACDLVSSYLSFCSVLLDRFFFMIFFPFCLRGSFSVCFPVKFCEDACGFWVSDRVIFRFPFRGFSQILELEFQNAAFLLAMLIFFSKKAIYDGIFVDITVG